MYLEIEDFLTAEECAELRSLALAGSFRDGLESAPCADPDLKRNEQLAPTDAQKDTLARIFTEAVGRSHTLQAFTQASNVRSPMLSRYLPGMHYGRHLDAPVLAHGGAMRTDLSITVFLSDPETYDGGALILDTPYGEIECKLPAGGAVCYSTLLWHQVEPVTRGERLALVSWFQSRIRDPQQRDLLFDVSMALRDVSSAAPKSEAAERLHRTMSNMIRLWSEV